MSMRRLMGALAGALAPWGLLLAMAAAAAASPPQNVVDALRAAREAYDGEQYATAADTYRAVLAGGWFSAELYYNLGCACYKAGELGWAVAYLEEARRLAPRDPDIRHNLRLAQARGRDRLPDEEPSRLLGLLSGLLDAYAPGDVVRLLLILLWGGAGVLSVHLLAPRGWRPVTRGALWGAGLALLVTAGAIALKAHQVSTTPSGAVVADQAQVLSGPRSGETVRFVLHAGTLLQLGRTTGAWREVWLSEEMRGWVPAEAVTELRRASWKP